MKRRCMMALVLSACMLLMACGSSRAQTQEVQEVQNVQDVQESTQQEEEETDDVTGQRQSENPDKAVVMVYMVGSNLESEAGMASVDIAEIIASNFDSENMEVLICTGGANKWWIDEIPNDECAVFEVGSEGLELVYTLNNENMADASTLREFINYGYMNYSVGYYDLVLWNHGGGAVLGYGADENYDYDTLSLTEMEEAIKGTKLIADGKRFEWIGFDACLMGMLEVADMMSEYADYLIASEEVEAGTGWDYSCFQTLSDGAHFEGDVAAKEIITAYSDYYETEYEYIPDYTLSCLDLSKTDEVVTSLEQFVDVAAVELQEGGYSRIARLRDRTKTFGKVSEDSFYDTVDLYDLADKMRNLYPDEATRVQEAVKNMVVYQESNIRDAYGVAIYFPYSNKEYAEEWIDVYSTIGFSEDYTEFIASFTDTLSGEQLAHWDIQEKVPEESAEEIGQYYVQLSEEQTANFGHGRYSVWEEDREGTYICWTDSSDISLNENGVLSADFNGRRFFLMDDTGELHVCCATELERNEEYAKYSIPIILEQKIIKEDGSEGWEHGPAYIHVKVDEEHPDGVIIGVYESPESDSTLFPNKEVIELEEGDGITPFLFARDIVFNEDGSVAPFEEWHISSGVAVGFTLEGDLAVTMQDTEPGTEYCFLFELHDTQGNYYITNPIYIEY